MIVSAKPLPINRRLGDVVIAGGGGAISIMQWALLGLGGYFFWQAVKRGRML